jgi:hypothetical protein
MLEPLDMSDFQVCIQCIMGKQTNKRNFNAERAKDDLELIHIDICGPFPPSSCILLRSKMITRGTTICI